MFDGDRIGYRLSLRDGTAAPLFAAVERGCWAFTADCPNAFVDRVPDSRGSGGWVAAEGVGTQVGLFDAHYRLQRTIDVRSPRFLETDDRPGRSAGLIAEMKWHETNSVIRRVYAFEDRIVTIHTTNATRD